MANLPTDPGTGLEPKMVLLPQLKRYDQKIKEKINNSSSSYITGIKNSDNIRLFVSNSILSAYLTGSLDSFISASFNNPGINPVGIISTNATSEPLFMVDPEGGIDASIDPDFSLLNLKLNVGKGVKLDPDTGALEANVDGITIGINGNTGKISFRPTESITVTNQPSSGSVTAQYNPGSVCIHFNDALVTGNSKTLVGKIPSVYAPSTAVTGTVLNPGSSWIMSAYSKVEPNGSIYINPIYSNAADLGWTGTLTYLI